MKPLNFHKDAKKVSMQIPFASSRFFVFDLGSSQGRIISHEKEILVQEPTAVLTNFSDGYQHIQNETETIPADLGHTVAFMQRGVIFDQDACLSWLLHYKKRLHFSILEDLLGPKAVMALPLVSDPVHTSALKQTLMRAGFVVEKQLLMQGILKTLPKERRHAIFIADFGAGKCEIGLFVKNHLVASAVRFRAGNYLTEQICEQVQHICGIKIGQQEAEELKKMYQIGAGDKKLTLGIRGKEITSGMPISKAFDATRIQLPFDTFCEDMVSVIEELLETSPVEYLDAAIKNGIVLVGGLSQMKGLSIFLQAQTSLPVMAVTRPRLAGALGLC